MLGTAPTTNARRAVSHLSQAGLFGLLIIVGTACPSAKPEPDAVNREPDVPRRHRDAAAGVTSSGAGSESDAAPRRPGSEFSRAAHADAIKLVEPGFKPWLQANESLGAALAFGEPLTVPKIENREENRRESEARSLLQSLAPINLEQLDPQMGRMSETMSFAAERVVWEQGEGALYSADPHAYLRVIETWMAEAAYRLRFGSDPNALAHVEDFQRQLRVADRHLTALPAGAALSAAALAEHLATQTKTLARLAPDRAASLTQLSEHLRGYGARLLALESETELAANGDELEWERNLGSLRQQGAPIRRPAVWGRERTDGVLKFEESWSPPSNLQELVEGNINRFATMREGDAPRAPGQPAEVDEARCVESWNRVNGFLADGKDKQGAPFKLQPPDCAAVVREWSGRSPSPAEFQQWALQTLLIPTLHHRAAANRGGRIGALRGSANPRVAVQAHTVMFAVRLGNDLARNAALVELQSALCLSVSALSLHAQIGIDPDQLDGWLERACPARPPKAWKREALADPRFALSGLPAAVLDNQPAGMVSLAEYPWAPMGIATLLAKPLTGPPPPGPNGEDEDEPSVKISVEELTP